jgi:hypothetical protein
MTRGPRYRALINRLLLLATLTLALAVAHGASAAPAGQAAAMVEEIQRQVAQVRGLDVRASTPVETLPRAALVQRLSTAINTNKAIREFLTSQMLLEVLGAMQPGFDLRELQLRLLAEQTVAVYDYDARSIYLVGEVFAGGALGADARLVVAHELTHALQDQHFDLKRMLPADPENSDAATAARALVEGDAMLTMRVWGRQFLRPDEKRDLGDGAVANDAVLDSAPSLVRGELLFPYDAGWVFAQLLYQDGGFAAIDRAFARPPRSTEQILHPEKYAAGERPVEVEMPRLERGLGGSWTTLRTDVFGELVLRLLLEPDVGWPMAEAAAAGWGGDAYSILEDAVGRRVVAIVTVWDTERDASEMYNAFVQSIAARHREDQQRTIVLPSVARWTVPEYQVQALKTDNVVRIVYAPDAPTLDLVESQLGGSAIGPAGPVAPPPATLPELSPVPTPSELPDDEGPSRPGSTLTPRPTPDQFSPGSPPDQPGVPGQPVPGVTPVPGDDPEDEMPPFRPAPDIPPDQPAPSLPPAEPMMPPQGGPAREEARPDADVQSAPTPLTTQPLPSGSPRPLPPESPADDEETPAQG